ncbi:hypothetical protein BaRGS_00028828 [Batillaria attramentaria]|uniref:Uncharacterized protein n=1 Tax=Batillaria attramentaria TaxID=370345 RepID=A0ABD0JZC2_9CAEN
MKSGNATMLSNSANNWRNANTKSCLIAIGGKNKTNKTYHPRLKMNDGSRKACWSSGGVNISQNSPPRSNEDGYLQAIVVVLAEITHRASHTVPWGVVHRSHIVHRSDLDLRTTFADMEDLE